MHPLVSHIFTTFLTRTLVAGPPLVFKVARRSPSGRGEHRASNISALSLVSVHSLFVQFSPSRSTPRHGCSRIVLAADSLLPSFCILSVSTPYSCERHWTTPLSRPGPSLATRLATTSTASRSTPGPRLRPFLSSFMTWHVCQDLPGCRTFSCIHGLQGRYKYNCDQVPRYDLED